MGVVKVQAVGAGAIDQRGDGGRIGLAVANHMGAPLGHFQARQGGQHGPRRLRVMARAQRDPDGVEDQRLGAGAHLGGMSSRVKLTANSAN